MSEPGEVQPPASEAPVGATTTRARWASRLRQPYVLAVLLPTLLLALYYLLICTDRYVSEARLIVERDGSAATSPIALGVLSLGGNQSELDVQLVKSFIESRAMLDHLDQTLALRAHYGSADVDWFSRLSPGASQEAFFEHYLDHISVDFGPAALTLDLSVQGFERDYAQQLASAIAQRAERFVNDIGRGLAREQVAFVKTEVDAANQRLQETSAALRALQDSNRLLSPEVETQSVSAVIAGLQQQLANQRTQMKVLLSYLSSSAAEVVAVRKQITALESQIAQERAKQVRVGPSSSLNQLTLRFQESQLDLQIATDMYQAGLKSLEAAKLDASRKVKHLVMVSPPTRPDASLQPRRFYNVASTFMVLNLLYWVGTLLLAAIRDHRE